MRRLTFLVVVLTLAAQRDAIGQRTLQHLGDMHHTSWTAQDGLRGFVMALAQTPDGFLWVGTSDGLYRFDGVRFESYQPRRGAMAAVAVAALAATPSGGLWVGHARGGVSYLSPDGSATAYGVQDSIPLSGVRGITIDQDGAVWLAATGGLARFADGRWQRIRKNWNYPCGSAWDVFVDRQGTLWVGGASPERLVYLPRGATRFVDMGIEESGFAFASVNDSTVVYGSPNYDKGTVVLLTGKPGGYSSRTIGAGHGANDIAVSNGHVWVAGARLTRLDPALPPGVPAEVDSLSTDGLSGTSIQSILVDREGSVWVGTRAGLDRLRHRNLTWKPDPLLPLGAALFTDAAGEAWVMTFRPTSIRRARDLAPVANPPELLDHAYLDPQGILWILTREGLFQWKDGRFIPQRPPAAVRDSTRPFAFPAAALARQRSGRAWVSIGGAGIFTLDDTTWTHREILPGHGDWTAVSAYADPADRIWLAYRDDIAMIDGDRIRVYGKAEGVTGPLTTIRGRDGMVLAGNEQGVQLFKDDHFYPVKLTEGTLGSVSTIVPTGDGVWLAGSAGVTRLSRSQLQRLQEDPASPVNVDLFDMENELPDAPKVLTRGFVIGTEDRDGILWFATNKGVARIDPRTIVRNPLPPPIAFRSVTADDRRYWPSDSLSLPPHTRSLRIEFTALSLALPSRVRFRHRLEGWEKDWHGPHSRREVTYTDLRPGRYTLRVMASNNDGVWSESGAALSFTVEPAWYQTAWFEALLIVTLVVTSIAAYQYRVRQLAASLSARFTERLNERTRIARDLHDTLMQTVQVSRMVAETSLATDDAQLRSSMQRLSAWLGQAVNEGRNALQALRAAPASSTDLPDALRQAADSAATDSPTPLTVTLRGACGELHPLVCDEIYHIGSEAIHNACTHARASRLEIEIAQTDDLVLRIADNGIGIDPIIAAQGKEGHYGLRGMRERAAAIGAALVIDSSTAGTSVTLTVPAGRLSRPDSKSPRPTSSHAL